MLWQQKSHKNKPAFWQITVFVTLKALLFIFTQYFLTSFLSQYKTTILYVESQFYGSKF